jgi:ATP adenylyltransferase
LKTLWAPWRLTYIESGEHPAGCIFCDLPNRTSSEDRREGLVLASDDHACVLINRFPYSHAHLMVAPRKHTADFARLDAESGAALQQWLQRSIGALEALFSPQGFNVGLNLGRAGGAGIADHMHWHVVPRWEGDTNFMPMLADTRVMPQHIEETYDRLLPHFS